MTDKEIIAWARGMAEALSPSNANSTIFARLADLAENGIENRYETNTMIECLFNQSVEIDRLKLALAHATGDGPSGKAGTCSFAECAACGEREGLGHYVIHRDGPDAGPEVPLCVPCGESAEDASERVREAVAQRREAAGETVYRQAVPEQLSLPAACPFHVPQVKS